MTSLVNVAEDTLKHTVRGFAVVLGNLHTSQQQQQQQINDRPNKAIAEPGQRKTGHTILFSYFAVFAVLVKDE